MTPSDKPGGDRLTGGNAGDRREGQIDMTQDPGDQAGETSISPRPQSYGPPPGAQGQPSYGPPAGQPHGQPYAQQPYQQQQQYFHQLLQ